MESIGKCSFSFILRIITDGCIIVNAATLITLPWLAKYIVFILSRSFIEYEPYEFVLVFLYICGILSFGILIQGHRILRTLEQNRPFDPANSKRFFRVGILCFFIAVAFFGKIFMFNTLLTLVATGLFAVACLVSLILADVFAKAAKIWEEHQLTV